MMVQCESYIQNDCVEFLKSKGYNILRVGRDGLPDIVALHPEEKGRGWHIGNTNSSFGLYIKWPRMTMNNPSVKPYKPGVTLFRALEYPHVFLEVKVKGGRRSKRQEIWINKLDDYGLAMFVDDLDELKEAYHFFLDIPQNM